MLSEKIYTFRRERGLSQEQLAEKIGVSRQAISKWEGGLSTPELDKLKALSDCFQVTIDELTTNQEPNAAIDDTKQEKCSSFDRAAEGKLGIILCLTGAVCLILFGILLLVRPSAMEQLGGSSTVTLNGTGMLAVLFIMFIVIGIILMLKRK